MLVTMHKIGDIKPYLNNPRKNAKAIDVVANSLEQFGFQQPIVVDSDKVIIVGHTRYQAAKKLGLVEVPVVIADTLTVEQTKQYRIMDNRSAENATWDNPLLFEELKSLLVDEDIQTLSYQSGFTESELTKFLDQSEPDLDKYLNAEMPRSRPGDVWILGDHKIFNGSSTQEDSLKTLMGEEMIDCVWEDPPYGVSYQSVKVQTRRTAEDTKNISAMDKVRSHKIENDDLSGSKLDEFLEQHMKVVNPYVKAGAPIYWCHDIRFNVQYKNVLESFKYHISDTLIWRKNGMSNWLCDYAKCYEPILYGWKDGQHPWYSKNMQFNCIDLDDLKGKTHEELIDIIMNIDTNFQAVKKESPKVAKLHPTVKPVKLIFYHLTNSTKPGEIVYDGFSGSGSTLLACEKSQRRARCIELEPKFVDVTIARWQEETGCEATRESDGVKWNDIVVEVNNDAAMEAFFNLPDAAEIENE